MSAARAPRAFLAPLAASVVALTGCGGAGKPSLTVAHRSASRTQVSAPSSGANLSAAERPSAGQFPSPAGRSLQQMAQLARAAVQLGPADAAFTAGTDRLAFALTDNTNRFVYAPTAVYLATSPSARARGPFLAPADSLGVVKAYQSNENDGPGGLKAIYWTQIPLPHAGRYYVLSLTRTSDGLVGGTGELSAANRSPIPAVGQRPPDVHTETLPDVHGDVGLLTTRMPPEQMHSVSFSQVLGRRPVALLISTPELCTSRVCGPVTDIMVSLQRQFPQITFIHQEVYVDNHPERGLRPQLKAFHLHSEPWLFVVDRRGVITARLEGAFGVGEARRALESALTG